MRRLFAILVLCAPLAGAAEKQAPAPTPAELAQALFEKDWQWRLRHQPELATTVGDHRFDDSLSDTSLAAARQATEHEKAMLDAIKAIDRNQLPVQDQISYDLFVDDKERKLATAAFFPIAPYPLTAQNGLQLLLPQLVAQMPFATEADYRAYIARLQAVPRHVDGLIEQMRYGIRNGWTAPKVIMQSVPGQLKALREHLADGVVGAPLRAIPATIDKPVREQLATSGQAALTGTVAPALQKLEDFVRNEYLPAAREAIAASSLPGGQPWYALLARGATTTSMTPAEIHALGLKEVARLRVEMKEAIARTGFQGSFAQFIVFAHSDPRLFYTDPEALLGRYRRTLMRARARLPDLLATVPQEDVTVKAIQPAGAEQQPAAYYEAGNAGRTAALVVNTSRLNTRPMWEVDTLALHEGVPGHHTQVARAHELDKLPAFRRNAWYVAFGEGWALYAEGLGTQMGFYKDAFSAFGHLNDELFRAARLVVDTGIHALGWSRQQAVDYMNANTANSPVDNEAEVDRYIAQPGQALGYKIGQLRIAALRDKAQAALGPKFDLKRFHNAVIDNGPLPLAVLEREIDRWIALENAPPKTEPAKATASAPAG
ncbi:DUF885 domain-containing protein [Massilia terrae]|uniref:DUF885 domain-containing protein n=1 Tax=Massilia terrae TaxID=1811224 RepID=A0ABT2D4Y6_9BURK|nr:DUF885 domain-containing protein [Massilia terrae]MCS0661105.1 DUF885 domain-containing protein [Massilia terrae]